MKNKPKKWVKPVIFIVFALAVVGVYIYLTHRNVDNTEKTKEETEVTLITGRDMTKNYPGHPKSVIEFYGDTLKVLYQKELTEQELTSVVEHQRAVLSPELLEKNGNDFNTYLENLKKEIKSFKDSDRAIVEYSIESGYNFKYMTYKKENYVKIDVCLLVREGKKLIRKYEKFTLRQEDGNWKILYWEVSSADEMEK